MIKAAIFDLGSVLATEDWPVIYGKLGKKLKISPEEAKNITQPLFYEWGKCEMKESSFGSFFWDEIERQTGVKLPKKFTNNFWVDSYKDWSKDIKKSWKILKALHKKGIRLAVLSNIHKTSLSANKKIGRVKRLKKAGVEAFIASCNYGFKKPDSEIYKITLKRLNLRAGECVFIDDKKINVEAAEKLGIHGIVFQAPKQLRKELIKLGSL